MAINISSGHKLIIYFMIIFVPKICAGDISQSDYKKIFFDSIERLSNLSKYSYEYSPRMITDGKTIYSRPTKFYDGGKRGEQNYKSVTIFGSKIFIPGYLPQIKDDSLFFNKNSSTKDIYVYDYEIILTNNKKWSKYYTGKLFISPKDMRVTKCITELTKKIRKNLVHTMNKNLTTINFSEGLYDDSFPFESIIIISGYSFLFMKISQEVIIERTYINSSNTKDLWLGK